MSSSSTGLGQSLSEYVHIHQTELKALIEAVDDEFPKRDIPTHLEDNFGAWYSRGVIKHTRRDPNTSSARGRWLWEVDARVRRYVASIEQDYQGEPLTPCCGIPKWVNLRDGPFECKACETQFGRDEFLGVGEHE